MANLIIKSSADNLVLQGSDASPAITVGATGTTTFAENATLSGTANNLGTSTAGTLSSGVTFPAGHIIQMRNKVIGPSSQVSTGDGVETDITGLTDTITITAGNKVLVIASATLFGAAGGTDAGMAWELYSVSGSAVLGIDSSTNTSLSYYWEAPGSSNPQHKSNSFIIHGPYTPSGTSEQVQLKYRGTHGATAYVNPNHASIQLWEVSG